LPWTSRVCNSFRSSFFASLERCLVCCASTFEVLQRAYKSLKRLLFIVDAFQQAAKAMKGKSWDISPIYCQDLIVTLMCCAVLVWWIYGSFHCLWCSRPNSLEKLWTTINPKGSK
jgi:hypothetical protein